MERIPGSVWKWAKGVVNTNEDHIVYSAESARVFRFQSARFCLSQNQVNDFLTYRAL